MRGRMSDAKSYADPAAIDEVMVGATVCQLKSQTTAILKLANGYWLTQVGKILVCLMVRA